MRAELVRQKLCSRTELDAKSESRSKKVSYFLEIMGIVLMGPIRQLPTMPFSAVVQGDTSTLAEPAVVDQLIQLRGK